MDANSPLLPQPPLLPHHQCRLLLILLNISITLISTVKEAVLVGTDVLIATAIATNTGLKSVASIPLLLLIGGRATSSRTYDLLGLDSGPLINLLSRPLSINCASFLVTQPLNMPSFMAVANSPLSILLLVMFLPLLILDTGANQHFTHDLATLTNSAPYLGNDYLHVGDGKGLSISHIGHTILCFPKHTCKLSNVLHVPYITKSLLSVQKFYRNNYVYFEFYAFVFYVKDFITKEVLFPVRVMMVSMFYLSLLPCPYLKLIGFFTSLRLWICGIVDWVIILLVFLIC